MLSVLSVLEMSKDSVLAPLLPYTFIKAVALSQQHCTVNLFLGLGTFSPEKKSVKFFTWGGSGQNLVLFTLFFIFFLSCPKSCKSAKKIFFSMGGRVLPYLKEKKILFTKICFS